MANYGIKVSQPGYNVANASPNELVFSSEYSTLRVRSQGSGTITHSGGRSVTISHNLGYVPYFLVHTTPDPQYGGFWEADDYFINPVSPVVMGACWIERAVTAYADANNLYIEVGDDLGFEYCGTYDTFDDYANEDDSGYNAGWFEVGNDEGPEDGAIRFLDIDQPQGATMYLAEAGIWVYHRYGTDDILTTVSGIDEDNTPAFDTWTAATARTKTSASVNSNYGSPDQGQYFPTTVTGIVNEILGRSGWSSGNAMGFIFNDNGTAAGGADGNTIYVDRAYDDNCTFCSCSYLKLLPSNNLVDYKYTIFYNKIE